MALELKDIENLELINISAYNYLSCNCFTKDIMDINKLFPILLMDFKNNEMDVEYYISYIVNTKISFFDFGLTIDKYFSKKVSYVDIKYRFLKKYLKMQFQQLMLATINFYAYINKLKIKSSQYYKNCDIENFKSIKEMQDFISFVIAKEKVIKKEKKGE